LVPGDPEKNGPPLRALTGHQNRFRVQLIQIRSSVLPFDPSRITFTLALQRFEEPQHPRGVESRSGDRGERIWVWSNPMHRKSGYLIGFGGALAMLSFIGSLEVEVAAARTGVQARPVQAIPINRTLKGDRLPSVPGPSSSRRPLAAPELNEPKLPDGCHAAMNPPKHAFAPEVPGRCVS
jgi:hypothetical protein